MVEDEGLFSRKILPQCPIGGPSFPGRVPADEIKVKDDFADINFVYLLLKRPQHF